MQFLLNKAKFNFGMNVKAQAYSPFNQVIQIFYNQSLLMIFKTEEVDYSQTEKEFQDVKRNSSSPLHS